eukprot:XP_001691241.1 predicted protein [Chlamydomonas reinhardtii]
METAPGPGRAAPTINGERSEPPGSSGRALQPFRLLYPVGSRKWNCRAVPNKRGDLLGAYHDGQTILAVPVMHAGASWLAVTLPDGRIGWCKQYDEAHMVQHHNTKTGFGCGHSFHFECLKGLGDANICTTCGVWYAVGQSPPDSCPAPSPTSIFQHVHQTLWFVPPFYRYILIYAVMLLASPFIILASWMGLLQQTAGGRRDSSEGRRRSGAVKRSSETCAGCNGQSARRAPAAPQLRMEDPVHGDFVLQERDTVRQQAVQNIQALLDRDYRQEEMEGADPARAQPGVEAAQQPSVEGCQGGVSADDVSEGPASVLARLQQQDSHASDTSDAAKPLAAGMEVEQVGGGEAVAEVAPGAEEAPGTEGTV